MNNKKVKHKIIILISIITVIIIIGLIIGRNVINVNIANEDYNASSGTTVNSDLIAKYIKKGVNIGGIIGTLEILDTSDATAKPEDIIYGKTAYVDGKKIIGTRITRDMLNVGDYVAYTPDTASSYSIPSSVSGYTSNQTITQESLKWQILSVNEDGTVDLVSSTPTTQLIYFGGAIGYNNGVYLLNDISAKLYSNSEFGLTTRSINIEDIEKHMTDEGLKYAHSYKGAVQWGEKYTVSSNYYPNIYAEENGSGINTSTVKTDGIEASDSYYRTPTTGNGYSQAEKTELTVTQTHYDREMSSNYYDDSRFFNLIYNLENTYWLASRYVNTYLDTDYAGFGIRFVGVNHIYGYGLFFSNLHNFSNNNPFRPIVTLKQSVGFYSGDGSEENPYQIEIM